MVLVPRSAPRHSFGHRGPEAAPNDTPGPGQYSSHNQPAGAGLFKRNGTAVFGTCVRSHRIRESPGPGTYAPLDVRKGPAFSCSPRRPPPPGEDTQDPDLGPGPGAYDESLFYTTQSSGPAFSMASTFSNFRETVSFSPGPGHYTDVGKQRRSARGHGFGTSRREPGHITKTPGPGQYAVSSTLGGPRHGLTPRRVTKWSSDNGVPGPGAHDHHPDFSDDAVWASLAHPKESPRSVTN